MMQFGCAWSQLQKASKGSVAVACWMGPDAMRTMLVRREQICHRGPDEHEVAAEPPRAATAVLCSIANTAPGHALPPELVELVTPSQTLDAGARVGVYVDA